MNKIIGCLTFGMVIAALAGCSENKQQTPTQQAVKNWNGARAAVLLGLARDQYQSGSFDKSRLTLSEAAKLDPDNSAEHILSAKLYIEAGQLEAAEKELEAARTLDAKNAEVEYLAGVVYQRWEQPERALAFYTHATELAPAELGYLMARAEMLVAMNRPMEALALLQEKVAYFEHSGVIRDEVGLLLLQQGKLDDAIEMLRRATILSEDDLTIREHLAQAQFQGRHFDDCSESLSRLLADVRYANRGDLLLTQGQCQLETGHAGDAVVSLARAAELMPTAASVWLALAKAQLQISELHGAGASLNKSLALDPSASGAHLLMGYLRLREARPEEAILSFQQANALDPTDTVSLCMIGYSLEKLGHTDAARRYYSRALEIKPGDELAGELSIKN